MSRLSRAARREQRWATGVSEARVAAGLERWPGVFRDEHGRILGFGGLTVLEMGEHRLHLDGRALSAWCAWDTLFLSELLGRTIRVTSRCPVTGERISLTAGPDGVTDLHPAEAVVSLLDPPSAFDADVIQSFCHYVHFFASCEAAARWTDEHPGTLVLSVEDAYELGRRTNRAVYGAVVGEAESFDASAGRIQ
jgi:alkylmercury lyase